MYPTATVGVGSSGTLAITGLALGGFLWAALILLALGLMLTVAAVARDTSLRRRAQIRT